MLGLRMAGIVFNVRRAVPGGQVALAGMAVRLESGPAERSGAMRLRLFGTALSLELKIFCAIEMMWVMSKKT